MDLAGFVSIDEFQLGFGTFENAEIADFILETLEFDRVTRIGGDFDLQV